MLLKQNKKITLGQELKFKVSSINRDSFENVFNVRSIYSFSKFVKINFFNIETDYDFIQASK